MRLMFPELIRCRCIVIVTTLVVATPAQADETAVLERGRAIYEAQCISCHGVNGAGTPDVPAPIFGDRATADLANLIDRTMPEGSPQDCVGDDARAVAEWMQREFYSPEAQARLNPPRFELSRLTGSQHRNAIADLAMSFRWYQAPGTERGLKAEYFADRRSRRDKRVIERTDATVEFSFAAGSPDAEKIPDAAEFSIEWQGSVIPRETGWYEFTVRTENGARLFVNDRETPLVDAWVRSGPETHFRGSRYLLAGRMYPLRLEWFKFKEPTASIALLWTPPHSVEEVLPASQLSPESAPQVLIIESPFPPDDRSAGYERGTAVSREWLDAATAAAIEAADKFVAMRRDLLDLKDGDDEQARLKEFALTVVERAFRRPLSDELRQQYVDAPFASTDDPHEALRRVVLLALKSPRFLYRDLEPGDDAFDRAERLSFALLDSAPDKQLLEAAKNGELETDDQLRQHAWRLVGDYRSRARLLGFLRSWLNVDSLDEIAKDAELYPDFTPQLASDMRVSLDLLLEQAVDHEASDLRTLLLSDHMFLNGRLAKFYGVDLPDGAAFQPIRFESDRRAGVLTHPFLLSGFAYTKTSSPIHRGVFISRSVLGRGVKPPPVAVAPTAPELAPELTTRERVTVQTSPEMCANCHGLINSLGFALENFDSVGRYRTEEKGRPVDASGDYLQRNGEFVRFTGARELAEFLARSEEVRRSFVRQLFHHMVQQPALAWHPETLNELSAFLESHNHNMKHLMVEIACRAARRPVTPTSETAVATGADGGQ